MCRFPAGLTLFGSFAGRWRGRGRSESAHWPGLAGALLIALAGMGCATGQLDVDARVAVPLVSADSWTPLPGDLLFQDLDGNAFCEAVEAVTRGWKGASLTHVGLVARAGAGELVVIEALGRGVVETPLAEFLQRSRGVDGRPKVLVARLKQEYQGLIPAAIDAARRRLGSSYDEVFDLGNDRYYCSELVHVALAEANGGVPLFAVEPMTFRDPNTGGFFPVWEDYFRERGVPIPEGQPGLNPGGMSRAACLRVVAAYGRPDGLRASLSPWAWPVSRGDARTVRLVRAPSDGDRGVHRGTSRPGP